MAPSWPNGVPSAQESEPMLSPAASLAPNRGAVYRPSISPRNTKCSSSSCTRKSENLILDEPALRTRITSVIASPDHRRALPAGLGNQDGDGARGQPGLNRIGPTGQNDGNARAEHDAGSIRVREKGEALGKHVAGFEIGRDQNVGA